MVVPKNLRASDQDCFTDKNRSDFKARKHTFSAKKMYEMTFSAIAIAVAVTFLVSNQMMSGAISCMVLGGVLFIIAKQAEHHRKLLTATEFLSALLSSALGEGYDFVMIIKKDVRKIVYLNNGFQKVFPEMVDVEFRKLDDLLAKYQAGEEVSKSIVQAVKKGTAKKISLDIMTGSGNNKKKSSMVFNIDPILRPAGFCLVRGKAKAKA